MITKPNALNNAARVWNINYTRNNTEFEKGDTLQLVLDGGGAFSHLVHSRPSTGSIRNLTPNNTAACLLNDTGLHIAYDYVLASGTFDISISFDVESNPMTFGYSLSSAGGGLPCERGGGN